MSVAASVLAFGVSIHAPKSMDERQWFNPGLGIAVQYEQTRGMAGYYRNSEDKDTVFVGFGGELPIDHRSGVTINAMLVTGYQEIPILAPVVTYYYDYAPLRTHAALMPEAVALFFEYRL